MNEREMLRHCLATLAYRAGKVLRDAPADFGSHRVGETTRTANEILTHLGDLLAWAAAMAGGKRIWAESSMLPWPEEIDRFFALLQRFDDYLASDQPLAEPAERLFQGPVADALTHVAQLALLRRLAGAPIRGENYFLAPIEAGRVSLEQAPPRREFD